MIYKIRDYQVMLDADLAKIYQVETKVFNQAVKRNIDRFPAGNNPRKQSKIVVHPQTPVFWKIDCFAKPSKMLG